MHTTFTHGSNSWWEGIEYPRPPPSKTVNCRLVSRYDPAQPHSAHTCDFFFHSGVSRNSWGGWGGRKCEPFFLFNFSAQKIAEKMILATKKVAKYRWNSLKFALMTFFLAIQFLGGRPGPPWTRACF